MDLFDLHGEIAFVTGAASGIGQRIAVGLAQAGAHVACVDRPGSALAATLEEIRSHGRRAIACEADVTDADQVAAAVARVEAGLGALSVAANCAGIADSAAAEDMTPAQWQRMLSINVTGVFLCCQAQARVMLPRGRGAIVNIASMSGSIVNRGLLQTHYNTSKAAVVHLTRCLAMEWCERGLRVNSISPGYTQTPMTMAPEKAELRRMFAHDTPPGRMARADEMVGPAIFLLSRGASFVTGTDLLVDGGYVCW